MKRKITRLRLGLAGLVAIVIVSSAFVARAQDQIVNAFDDDQLGTFASTG